MPRLAAGDVPADADPELGEDVGDVPQPVGAYEQRVNVQSPCGGRTGGFGDSMRLMIIIII
jgi:hypothetical protein